MIPTPSNLHRITEAHLLELVGVAREDRHIDYKEAMYPKELLAKELSKDITAFANTEGGCIVIGVKESGGVASEICGIDVPNADQLYRQVQQAISSNTRPSPFVRFHSVPLTNGKSVIIIAAPFSRHRPHMVTAIWPGVFYKRTDGANNEAMDLDDIRRAFANSASSEEVAFDAHRGRVHASAMPSTELGLHLSCFPVPFDQERLDFMDSKTKHAALQIRPVGHRSYDHRLTFDGFLLHDPVVGYLEH